MKWEIEHLKGFFKNKRSKSKIGAFDDIYKGLFIVTLIALALTVTTLTIVSRG